MKYLILLNILFGLWAQFHKVAITNELKSEAEKAYQSEDFKKASVLYQSLITVHHLEEEKIRMNLASALFLNDERKRASVEYLILTDSPNLQTRSIAFQQLGVIAALKGKYKPALSDFKQALETDPGNEKARYNYELVKKIYDEELSMQQSKLRKKEDGDEKQKDVSPTGAQTKKEALIKQLNAEGSKETHLGEKETGAGLFNQNDSGMHEKESNKIDPSSQDKEKEPEADEKGNKDIEALKSKRLNEIKISEDKAKMILELMKNEEIQYLQQRRRVTSNKEYKNKPDW